MNNINFKETGNYNKVFVLIETEVKPNIRSTVRYNIFWDVREKASMIKHEILQGLYREFDD